MKITKVECLVLANEHPIVRLETDEGLVGWGECFRRARALVQPAIEHVFGPALLGQDPLDTEVLHRRLMGMGQVAGPAGTLAVAVAGVDIALWDLKGKALGQPIWQLLGGRVRARVPVYASSLRRAWSQRRRRSAWRSWWRKGTGPTSCTARCRGWTDDPGDRTLETVRAIRELVGADVRLLVDVNGTYSVPRAIHIGRRLEELGVTVFECPVPEHDHTALAQVADAVGVAVAAGESHYTARAFQALIVEGRIDVLQPDVVKAAGLTELQKIAVLAHVHGKPMTVHNTQPTLCTAAHLHFCAVHPHVPYEQEYNIEPVSIRDEWPILPGQLTVEAGHIAVPDGPGLGVEVDEAMVRRVAEMHDVRPGL